MAGVTDNEGLEFLPGARAFASALAPSYIDHACMMNGYAPPPGSPLGEGVDAGFSYCELDCGSAATETLLAASNPLGNFFAIDARSELIERGRTLAADGKVRNIVFHEANLEQAFDLSLPPLDYIVVEGIYSWVPIRQRALVLAFVRKFLRPGGAVIVSYNARPGWNRLDLFRRLFREATPRGEPHRRLEMARDLYRRLLEAKAPSLLAAGLAPAAFAELQHIPEDALVADYLNDFAEPLYVSEVAADFAAIDCLLAGAADMAQSLPTLEQHEPFKSALERVPSFAGRELAKDMLLDTRFRRDVFIRGGQRLSAGDHDMVMHGLAFALEQPADLVRYRDNTSFGQLSFDNPHARKLVELLSRGPCTLGELVAQGADTNADFQTVVANVHALIITGQLRPVYRATREAADGARSLQAAIRARAVSDEAIGFLPSPFGTAFAVPIVDQLLMDIPGQKSADAMAKETLERFVNSGRAFSSQEALLRRARSFRRNLQHYATLGVAPA